MAIWRLHEGKCAEALEQLTRSADILASSLGEHHPQVLQTRRLIEACLQ
tara:strand:+ start:390 stop:536 length:147 start_codon:yes stop_codon:yes gene_type:complete